MSCISDTGIKRMKSHTIYANSPIISDAGIKRMKLHTIYVSDADIRNIISIWNINMPTLNNGAIPDTIDPVPQP